MRCILAIIVSALNYTLLCATFANNHIISEDSVLLTEKLLPQFRRDYIFSRGKGKIVSYGKYLFKWTGNILASWNTISLRCAQRMSCLWLCVFVCEWCLCGRVSVVSMSVLLQFMQSYLKYNVCFVQRSYHRAHILLAYSVWLCEWSPLAVSLNGVSGYRLAYVTVRIGPLSSTSFIKYLCQYESCPIKLLYIRSPAV